MADDLRSRYPGWALVTGASSGIGEAYAEAFAARGFPVVLVARRKDRLEALGARLAASHKVETLVVVEDLSRPGACGRVRDAVGAREVGVLVNNAGFGFSGRFAENSAEDDEQMIAVNCAAVATLTHLFLPPMLARRRGAVLIVASAAAFQPTPWFAVYGATKAFDLHLAEALWSELRGTGVDVIGVCPAETQTEFHERAHAKRSFKGMTSAFVVEKSLAALGKGPSVVPGMSSKLVSWAHRLFPRRFVADSTGAVLARQLLLTSSSELRGRPYDGTSTPPRSR
jgi:short-subunit dehydrogenase